MGSWHETCFVSHLPIFYRDEAVAFILTPTIEADHEGTSCYHDTKYAPLSFPLRGTYDDYGKLTDIADIDFHETFLSKMKPYFIEKGREYIPYEWTSVSNFMRDIVARRLYVSVPGLGYKHLTISLMHAELYDRIMHNMENRIVYGHDLLVRTVYENRTRKALAEYKEAIEHTHFFRGTFCESMRLDPSKYRHLESIAREFIYSSEYADHPGFVNFMIWHQVMLVSRLGYCTSSGRGGEESEYAIPKIVAQFIFEMCDKYIEKRQEWDEDDFDATTALEESIYL